MTDDCSFKATQNKVDVGMVTGAEIRYGQASGSRNFGGSFMPTPLNPSTVSLPIFANTLFLGDEIGNGLLTSGLRQ